jgi:hypothetical protein
MSMLEFFREGGWGMYPVLVLGLMLIVSGARYMLDGEPVRLRFIGVLSLAHLAFIATGLTADVAKVFWYLHSSEHVPDAELWRTLFEGLKESSGPALLGFPLLGLALILVTIGVYRVGNRELAAARG